MLSKKTCPTPASIQTRTEIDAMRVNKGTFPENSTWTVNPLLPRADGGEKDMDQGTVYDLVQIPNLEPGKYVLSFRWDCKCTLQIWTTCATINII